MLKKLTNIKQLINAKNLIGNLSDIWGDVSGLSGDVTGVCGNVSGLVGNLDDCEISAEDRKAGIDICGLVA